MLSKGRRFHVTRNHSRSNFNILDFRLNYSVYRVPGTIMRHTAVRRFYQSYVDDFVGIIV